MRNQESWRQRRHRSETDATYYRHGSDPPRISDFPLNHRPPVLSLGRLLILAWLIAWISTIPLFHIHLPDTTDRWSVLQSGGAHTVVTPDLPGEYAAPSHDSDRESSARISTRVVNSPELGFIVFGEQTKKWEAFTILDFLSHFRAPPLFNRLALAFFASRAPPRSLCA